MFRLRDHVPSHPAQRVRGEITAAKDHLRAVAEHSVQRAGDTTRRTGEAARDRAARAARAARGEQSPSPWRWLGIGLVAGAAMVAAGAVAVKRWREPATAALREKADTAVEAVRERTDAVRERTTAAAHRATDSARDAIAKARDAAKVHEPAGGGPDGPDGAPPSLDRATPARRGAD